MTFSSQGFQQIERIERFLLQQDDVKVDLKGVFLSKISRSFRPELLITVVNFIKKYEAFHFHCVKSAQIRSFL